MGQKTNPISLRLQKTNRRYDSSWYSNYHYGELFLFDLKVRDYLERILKQIKYPQGRVLISHFSKSSKINLFKFNPYSSRQQKLAPFGLKGGVLILKPFRPKVGQHVPQHLGQGFLTHKQELQRKVSPVFGKEVQRTNELKRPLRALSSKSKAFSIDQQLLLANQKMCEGSWYANCLPHPYANCLPHPYANCFARKPFTCPEKENSVLGDTTTTTTLVCKAISKPIISTIKHNTTFKQNTNKNASKWNPFLPYLALDCSASGTKCVPSLWQHNGSHLLPFFALKDTLNPSYLLKAKRLRDFLFGTHSLQSLCVGWQVRDCAQQKQQMVSKTLSLWQQRAQGSTHPLLVTLGADKKTIPFLTKETSCKAVAKSNPSFGLQSKTWNRKAGNRLPVKQPVGDPKREPLKERFQQKVPSFSLHRNENSLYRCHVEGVLDQQTGSSVKLVPFQVSTERQSALFLAQEVVYFLERRVSFRKIKSQILKELKGSKIIKGVRITCSGRVGGKSKKAQKAKTETVKQGQTSLGVFSSRIDFAQKSALTSFGLIGVKVWICFY